MNCPYCHKEMKLRYLHVNGGPLMFSAKQKRLNPYLFRGIEDFGIKGEIPYYNHLIQSYYCEDCNLILLKDFKKV